MLKFHRTQVVWFEIYETTKVAPLFEHLNSIESECEKVLNILNPFLTNEFLSFFEYYKNIPCFYGRRSLEPLSKQDLKHINERMFDFIPQGLKKVRTLSQEINNRIESSKSRNVALGK